MLPKSKNNPKSPKSSDDSLKTTMGSQKEENESEVSNSDLLRAISNLKADILAEINQKLDTKFKELNDKIIDIENSQDLISHKFDELKSANASTVEPPLSGLIVPRPHSYKF